MKALEDMDDNERLALLEQVHRDRVGPYRRFAYVATQWSGKLWQLSFVEEHEPGYYPITDDIFLGSERTMRSKADELNLKRLNLLPYDTAMIVASSMTGTLDDGRKSRHYRPRQRRI